MALTRAKDVLSGFSVDNPRSDKTVAGVLKDAFTMPAEIPWEKSSFRSAQFITVNRIFEFGEIPENKSEEVLKK